VSEVFFAADWHLGREVSSRPFGSVEEMNEEIIRRHNEWVAPGDLVWVAGNAAANLAALELCQRLNGKLHLICGPSDRAWAGYPQGDPQSVDWQKRYREIGGFDGVITGRAFLSNPKFRAPIRVGLGFGAPFVDVWPFPRVGDTPNAADLTAAWRPRRVLKPSTWLLHGTRTDSLGQVDSKAKQISVAADEWNFEPVHVSRVIELIDQAET
jgi:calcineurin-like phosphoesterase family protein